MRNRVKRQVLSSAVHYSAITLMDGSWQPDSGGGTVSVVAHPISERMEDNVVKSLYHMNECRHWKRESLFGVPNSGGGVDPTIAYVNPSGFSHGYTGYPVSAIAQNSLSYLSIVPQAVSPFEKLFWDTRLPTEIRVTRDPFDTGFSIWYLVVDLVDLTKLYTKVFGFVNSYGRFRANKLRRLKTALVGRESDTALQLHNANLAISFGILPTVKDFQDFASLVFKWREAYDRVKELVHQNHVLHLPKERLTFADVPAHTVNTVGHVPEADIALRANVHTSVGVAFHRSLLYRYTAPEFLGWISRVAQFVDAFGILDPAAIWDVIPFSFVVDWFLGIGAWLHNNRPRLYSAGVNVLGYCESISSTVIVDWYADWYEPVSGSPPNGALKTSTIGTERYTYYVRRKWNPKVHTFLDVSAPRIPRSFVNLRRISIASSLIAQRLPR